MIYTGIYNPPLPPFLLPYIPQQYIAQNQQAKRKKGKKEQSKMPIH
jgi:hypothetical protein